MPCVAYIRLHACRSVSFLLAAMTVFMFSNGWPNVETSKVCKAAPTATWGKECRYIYGLDLYLNMVKGHIESLTFRKSSLFEGFDMMEIVYVEIFGEL